MQRQISRSAESTARVVERPAWSPAQLLALVGGIVLVVIGGIALARTGTDFSNIPATHATVAGLHFTCLSAIVQLVAGVVLLVGTVRPASAKWTSAVLGVLSLAWGIIIVAGAILLLGGVVSPIFFSRRGEVRSGSGQYVDTAPRF